MKRKLMLCLLFIACCFTLCACGCKHEWKEATCTEPMVCTLCGKTMGVTLEHEWKEATCTEPMVCTICGKTKGEPLGHEWKEADCTTPKTCKVCNETEGAALGHQWLEATCTEPNICSVCGAKKGRALGHDWVESTCTEEGICLRCELTKSALGHSWKNATCTEPKTCKRCNITEGEPLGHRNIIEPVMCKERAKCGICNEEMGEPLAHIPADTGICERCGKWVGIDFGSYIFFGKYEQDNNPDNGPEPIEWLVVGNEKEENGQYVLLVSKYILDWKPFDDAGLATWADCSLRKWLNSEFYNMAFDENEKDYIEYCLINNPLHLSKNESPGWSEKTQSTYDYVFLLSWQDVYYELMQSENEVLSEAYKGVATEYAKALAEKAGQSSSDNYCNQYFLRTPSNINKLFYVETVDKFGEFAGFIARVKYGVRPAIYIYMEP